MRLHVCPLDAECRKYDAPWRIYVFTERFGNLTIGLRWRDRTQLWLPWKTRNPWAESGRSNYSRWWSPVVWDPSRAEAAGARRR